MLIGDFVVNIWISSFEFVSDSGFRDLGFRRIGGRAQPDRIRNNCVFLLMWVTLLAFPSAAAADGAVEILRDPWGTPHVFADTDEGTMFGLGYASAEDRFFQMCFNRLVMQGRVAEVFGDLGDDGQALNNDRQMRTLGTHRAARTIAENLHGETRQLLQAFADGVNAYAAANSDNLHYLFRRYEFVPEPWSPADSILAWWHLVGGFWRIDGRVQRETQSPRMAPGRQAVSYLDEDAAVVKRDDVSDDWLDSLHRFLDQHGLEPYRMPGWEVWEGLQFSHGWALGKNVTESGSALLVGDPQLPIGNPSDWYEFHVSGKTIHARGIGFPGAAGLFVGFTPGVAWTGSALAADQSDMYILSIHPDNPDQYLLDGRWRDMDVRTEQILVKGGQTISLKVQETVFGPVVSTYITGLNPGEGAALKRVPLDNLARDTHQALFAMMRARNAEDFLHAARDWRYVNLNCVFADSAGTVGYTVLGDFPLMPPGKENRGDVALDGTRSANNWRGTIPFALLPQVLDPGEGFVVTANDRPIQSFYPIRLGLGAGGETLRGLRIKQRIREHLAQGQKFSFADNLAVQYDSVHPMHKTIISIGYHLRDALKEELPTDVLEALAYLETWYACGAPMDWRVPGAELVSEFRYLFRPGAAPAADVYGGGNPGGGLFVKSIAARLKEDPPAPLLAQEKAFAVEVLSDAWNRMRQSHGDDPAQWRERAIRARNGATIGYYVNRNRFPSLDPRQDVVEPLLPVEQVPTILSQRQQSYTQVVDLSDPDASLSLLPFGNSERPDSPFRFASWTAWVRGELRPAPLSRKAVENLSVSRKILNRDATDEAAGFLPDREDAR